MAEVREGVDMLDRDLIALLERRFGYMRAAARIKPDRESVRDETRKQRVIAAAVAQGEAAGIPSPAIAAIWEALVEASIAYEFDEWDQLKR